jgi:hypothetical protein
MSKVVKKSAKKIDHAPGVTDAPHMKNVVLTAPVGIAGIVPTKPVTNMEGGSLVKAIANDAKIQIAQGKNALLRMAPYISAVAAGEIKDIDADAKPLLNKVRDAIVAHRASLVPPDTREVAEVSTTRSGEFKHVLRLGTYACHKDVIAMFDGYDVNLDNVVTIAKFIAETVKEKNGPAPAREAVFAKLAERKGSRRGSEGMAGDEAQPTKPAGAVLKGIGKRVDGWRLWFGLPNASKVKDEASAKLDELKGLLASIERLAKAVP